MTYRFAIMDKNGSMRSSHADASLMAIRTRRSYSAPRNRMMFDICRCVSTNARISLTSLSTFAGFPFVWTIIKAAIRQSSGDGSAGRTSGDSMLIGDCSSRDAPRRRTRIAARNRTFRNLMNNDGSFINHAACGGF